MTDLTTALKIARKAAVALAQVTPARAERVYLPAEFDKEYATAFSFFAACPRLLERDFVPGGFFVFVAKSDGHVLTSQEIAELFEAQTSITKAA